MNGAWTVLNNLSALNIQQGQETIQGILNALPPKTTIQYALDSKNNGKEYPHTANGHAHGLCTITKYGPTRANATYYSVLGGMPIFIGKWADGADTIFTGWRQIATAEPPQEYLLPLADEYESTPGYCAVYGKDIFSRVYVTFHVNRKDKAALNASTVAIATLPVGFRPEKSILVSGLAHNYSKSIPIIVSALPNGRLAIHLFESLTGLSYAMGEVTFLATQ